MIKIIFKSKSLLFLIFILLLVIPLLDLLHPGLPITHDGKDHVARIANFYQSLSEGNLIPRWAGNLNWGYGHPILMFLYPLSSYLGSMFHFFGVNFTDSTKAVFAFGYFFSGLFMYLWLKEIWSNEAGIIGGLVYTLAPYRFVDLYVRGAIGENLAFVWLPLACYFGYKIFKKVTALNIAGAMISIAFLILSHNAISLMFLPLIFGYYLFLAFTNTNKFKLIKIYLITLVNGFMISIFFWLPAYIEGKYTLRDIVTQNTLTGFDTLGRLIWSDWSFGGTGSLSIQIGITQWLMIVLSPVIIWIFFRKKNIYRWLMVVLLLIFWISIFLILPISKPIYEHISLLQKFQFVWRFVSLSLVAPSVFAAALISLITPKNKTIITLLIIAMLVILNKNYWHPLDYLSNSDSYYSQPYVGTTDTGESAPIWSVRFMEHFPTQTMEFIYGEGKIQVVSHLSNYHEYLIDALSDSRILENTLYFPGWVIIVDNHPVTPEFQDPDYRGLMTFLLPQGQHTVKIYFQETRLRQIANLLSVIGIGFVIILLVLGVFQRLRYNNIKL